MMIFSLIRIILVYLIQCTFCRTNGQINDFNGFFRYTWSDDDLVAMVKSEFLSFYLFFVGPFSVFRRALLNEILYLTFRIIELFTYLLLYLLSAILETAVHKRYVWRWIQICPIKIVLRVFQFWLVIILNVEIVFIFSGGVGKLSGIKAWILCWDIFGGLKVVLVGCGIYERVKDFGQVGLIVWHLWEGFLKNTGFNMGFLGFGENLLAHCKINQNGKSTGY